MTIGVIARKVGMTRVFTSEGVSVPVSVLEVVGNNRISQIKSIEVDGYEAIQVTAGEKKSSRVNKPLAGHFAKAQVTAGDMIGEFSVESIKEYSLGQLIDISDVFNDVEFVDVVGVSKGKGFAGSVKRHNFRTQDATHGNSRSHRVLGSTGQNQTPGRVFKGKKMAGHLGNVRCTVQNLELVRIDKDRNLILVKGAVPGFMGARVEIKPAIKKKLRGE